MKLFTIGIFVICVALSAAEVLRDSPKLAELVPTINQENFKLMPIDDKFNLSYVSNISIKNVETILLLLQTIV